MQVGDSPTSLPPESTRERHTSTTDIKPPIDHRYLPLTRSMLYDEQ
jgi:hypothetical protein